MTEGPVHIFCNSASKSRGESKPIYNKGEKLDYDMLILIFNMKFILILRGVSWTPKVQDGSFHIIIITNWKLS